MYFLALAVVAFSFWLIMNAMENEPQVRPVAVKHQQPTRKTRLR